MSLPGLTIETIYEKAFMLTDRDNLSVNTYGILSLEHVSEIVEHDSVPPWDQEILGTNILGPNLIH